MCSRQPTHQVANAAHPVVMYTHIMLKSMQQPHCPQFCIEKLDLIQNILVRPNVKYTSLIFGLNSM